MFLSVASIPITGGPCLGTVSASWALLANANLHFQQFIS